MTSLLPILLGLVLLYCSWEVKAFKLGGKHCGFLNKCDSFKIMARGENEDSVSRRRRKRRGSKKVDKKPTASGDVSTAPTASTTTSEVAASASAPQIAGATAATSVAPSSTGKMETDGSNSLEDLFGLGDDQLRELNEQSLPVPREDLVTGKEVVNEDSDKVFKLPDLAEFMQETGGQNERDRNLEARKAQESDDGSLVNRRDQDEYLRVLQLNPFADADDTMFVEEYDIFQSIFGTGKLLNIPVPYLQTGHGILLIVSLLAGFVYAPGNPVTEFPPEIREFIRNGIFVSYSINTVLAIQAFFIATSKNLPGLFWVAKTFLLGGIAFYELGQVKDPKALPEYKGIKPSDRKSKR